MCSGPAGLSGSIVSAIDAVQKRLTRFLFALAR